MSLEASDVAELVAQVVREHLAADRSWMIPKVALSIAEAAHALSISRAAAYRLVAAGELPVVIVGTKKVVPVIALQQWVAAHTEHGIEAAA